LLEETDREPNEQGPDDHRQEDQKQVVESRE
jgi:hypothetical protein